MVEAPSPDANDSANIERKKVLTNTFNLFLILKPEFNLMHQRPDKIILWVVARNSVVLYLHLIHNNCTYHILLPPNLQVWIQSKFLLGFHFLNIHSPIIYIINLDLKIKQGAENTAIIIESMRKI